MKEKMTEQPWNKMSFETLIQTCMVNFGLSPVLNSSFSPTPLTTPHLLHCIIHLLKASVLLSASQGDVLSDPTGVDWQKRETFPFWTAKTSEHKALFFVSLLIFLERLPTYQILQWSHNHCASAKSLPTVIKTHQYNSILGSSWWRKIQ